MKYLSLVSFVLIFFSCSTFKGNIPIEQEVSVDYYISPLNQDGINDEFTEDLNIPDIKGLNIIGSRFYVESIYGEIILEKKIGVDFTGKKSSIFKKPKSIKKPETISWNGLNNQDEMSTDGLYLINLEVWGLKGNRGSITPIRVVVDNTVPSAELSIPFDTFSPNLPNGLNVLSINQVSSSEDLWTGSLINKEDVIISTYKWDGITQTLDLDGFDNSGNKIPDGDYRYELKSTDRAGNSFVTGLNKITIDRRASKLFFTDGEYFLSPNGDGIKDTIKLNIDSNTPSLDFAIRTFDIIDSNGKIVKTYKVTDNRLPSEFIFDGLVADKKPLEEGIYYSHFTSEFINKTKAEAFSNKIYIDITTPESVLSSEYSIFSPDGDGNKDTLLINQSTSVEGKWIGEIINEKNVSVLRKEWEERAVSFLWDGLDNNRSEVPDGIYYYNLFSEDMAGNNKKFTLGPFKVDRTETLATLSVNTNSFSPNRDGISDYIEFLLGVSVRDGIDSWSLSIFNKDDEVIHIFNGDSILPKNIPWFGDSEQLDVKDGVYSAELNVIYNKGNIAIAKTKIPFSIDLNPPTVTVNIEPLLFSPDGDGVNDKLFININAKDDKNDFTITGEIQDPRGTKFKSLSTENFKDNKFVWDGYSDNGELVQSASDYSLILKAVDAVGNKVVSITEIPIDILVMKEGNKLKIIVSSIIFKPYTADFINIEPEQLEKNLQTINRLSEVLKKYSTYKISIEGNAVRIFWNDPKKWIKEENDILLPLSVERAEIIKDALISKGVKSERMSIQGFGGYVPVVPHSDLDNRWKNRRVEFILIK